MTESTSKLTVLAHGHGHATITFAVELAGPKVSAPTVHAAVRDANAAAALSMLGKALASRLDAFTDDEVAAAHRQAESDSPRIGVGNSSAWDRSRGIGTWTG